MRGVAQTQQARLKSSSLADELQPAKKLWPGRMKPKRAEREKSC